MTKRPRLPLPVLSGDLVRLRPWTPGDVDHLEAILAEPSVAQWWGLPTGGSGAREWLESDEDQSLTFVIQHEGQVIGSIQCSEEAEPDYRSPGIDLFLATRAHSRGLGRRFPAMSSSGQSG